MLMLSPSPAGSLKRILCLGAHCDDLEIGCGATVMQLLERHPAATVDWVVLTSTPARAAEARAAAAELLAGREHTVHVRDFRDGYLPAAWSDVKECLAGIRQLGTPDLVLCHHREDLHQDHRLVGELAWQVFREQPIWEYEIPKYDGDRGRPNLYVPVNDEQVRRKVELILRHFPSQAGKPWFSAETFRALLRLRGIEVNSPWAEAFHVAKCVVAP